MSNFLYFVKIVLYSEVVLVSFIIYVERRYYDSYEHYPVPGIINVQPPNVVCCKTPFCHYSALIRLHPTNDEICVCRSRCVRQTLNGVIKRLLFC